MQIKIDYTMFPRGRNCINGDKCCADNIIRSKTIPVEDTRNTDINIEAIHRYNYTKLQYCINKYECKILQI